MMKQVVALTFLLLTILSCKSKDNSCGKAYFGGEIINPNSDYVIFYNDMSFTADTLYLDDDNRFFHTVETLHPGLHSFVHGGEYQIAILEPNDSVMIRLNTLDFDESLVFTGRGSKKNNFLIGQYVTLDKEEKKIYELFKLDPEAFQKEIDSLKELRKQKLTAFTTKQTSSKLFVKVANSSIDFNYDAYCEIYPFRHFKKDELADHASLPSNFYTFRNGIDYNDELFTDFYPFYNFLVPHFDNLALKGYFQKTNDTIFDRNSVVYNLEKLELIDKNIYNKNIKNNLLKYCTKNYLSNANTMEDCESMYDSYMEKSTDEEHSEHISNLFNTLKNIQPGNKLPHVEVINEHNETVNINEIIKKPTVVFFWSKAIKNHFRNSHKKVSKLREAYPDIHFISINIDTNNTYLWKRLLAEHNFSTDDEYRFRNPKIAKKLLAINYVNKVMVLDKNGTIVSSNASMFKRNFRDLLDSLNP